MRPGQGKKNQTDFRFWQEFCFASKKLDVQKVRISFGEDEAYIYGLCPFYFAFKIEDRSSTSIFCEEFDMSGFL